MSAASVLVAASLLIWLAITGRIEALWTELRAGRPPRRR